MVSAYKLLAIIAVIKEDYIKKKKIKEDYIKILGEMTKLPWKKVRWIQD